MLSINRILQLFGFVTVMLGTSAYAQVTWDFGSSLAPSSSLPANVTGGTFSSGQNTGTFGLSGTSSSSGYTGASGGNNVTIGVAPTGAFSASGSAYFTFSFTASNGAFLNATGLKLGSRSTASGPTLLSLFVSTDNFSSNSSSLGTVTATANSSWALLNFGSFNISAPANGTLTFRLYGSDGTGSTGGGNWRIDDVNLSLAAISSAPFSVPEPGAAALLAGAFTLAIVIHQRRRA